MTALGISQTRITLKILFFLLLVIAAITPSAKALVLAHATQASDVFLSEDSRITICTPDTADNFKTIQIGAYEFVLLETAVASSSQIATSTGSYYELSTDIVAPFFYRFSHDVGYYSGSHWSDESPNAFLKNCSGPDVHDWQEVDVTFAFDETLPLDAFVMISTSTVAAIHVPASRETVSASSTRFLHVRTPSLSNTNVQNSNFISGLTQVKNAMTSSSSASSSRPIVSLLPQSKVATSTIDPQSARNLLGTTLTVSITDEQNRPINSFKQPVTVTLINSSLRTDLHDAYGFLKTDSGWFQQKWSQTEQGLAVNISLSGEVSLWSIALQQPAAAISSISKTQRIMNNWTKNMPIISFALLLAGIILLYQKMLNMEVVTHTMDGMRLAAQPDPFRNYRNYLFLFLIGAEVILVTYAMVLIFLL